MNFEEHAAKPLLQQAGISVPDSRLVSSPRGAQEAAGALGPCVAKAQVPTGKRGKVGGIQLAATPQEAQDHAKVILGMTIGGHKVERLLIEAQIPILQEMYGAVINDPATKGPLLLFCAKGGMDIEQIAADHPGELIALPIDIRHGLNREDVSAVLPDVLPVAREALADLLVRLYGVYAAHDAELLEINPLAVTKSGDLYALDCKFVMDDGAAARHARLAQTGTPELATELEARASRDNLKYIELDGSVGVLANGAGLTMTSMDAIAHFGGAPANFLEIGGESYTKAKPALELVLANRRVKALLVNFCGAFARTDVMTEGVIDAWLELKPDMPIFFTIHGTGEVEAIAMVRERLGLEPYDVMDDAVRAAVAVAVAVAVAAPGGATEPPFDGGAAA